ncbi:LuxR family two component transcriptional regulator [Fluviicoccus keumensis]|uniref:LuxR family two component transcriptional regulator n=1 Tax=Fluviicoccus keumensis TaxID=1435465 RepID=A0A4V6MFS0_9GAMM|nr:response regulator transcription factor [Fluviicoccus keumensis]RZU38446.1 LuxR family two component transcriptional regulator [Fluviicoccus keumensis]
MVNILLVDDHQLVRKGLKALLESHEGYQVIAEASNGRDALLLIDSLRPDLVLLDIMMPEKNGLEVAAEIVRRPCAPKILLLTMCHIAEYISEALKLGIQGYVVKDAAPTELFNAIDTIMRDEIYLSPSVSKQIMTLLQKRNEKETVVNNLTGRQVQILKLIALGYSSKAMADELSLSVKTIEAHRSQLMQRLGIREVASLVRYAMRVGLIEE